MPSCKSLKALVIRKKMSSLEVSLKSCSFMFDTVKIEDCSCKIASVNEN